MRITNSLLVEAKNISFSYGGFEALENISFSIKKGDFVGLVGPNGSGKTTLVKILLGLLKPKKGDLRLFGRSLSAFNEWGSIGYVPQRLPIDKNFPGTVKEILSLREKKNHGEYAHLEETIGLSRLLPKKFSELSGGEQQRVLMALCLLSSPKLLILDEPEVGVDQAGKLEFYSILKHLNEHEKVAIILITHDIGVVSKYVKRIICLNRNICCEGSPKKADSLLKRLYGKHFEVNSHRH